MGYSRGILGDSAQIAGINGVDRVYSRAYYSVGARRTGYLWAELGHFWVKIWALQRVPVEGVLWRV